MPMQCFGIELRVQIRSDANAEFWVLNFIGLMYIKGANTI